jgi:hypothetical protein
MHNAQLTIQGQADAQAAEQHGDVDQRLAPGAQAEGRPVRNHRRQARVVVSAGGVGIDPVRPQPLVAAHEVCHSAGQEPGLGAVYPGLPGIPGIDRPQECLDGGERDVQGQPDQQHRQEGPGAGAETTKLRQPAGRGGRLCRAFARAPEYQGAQAGHGEEHGHHAAVRYRSGHFVEPGHDAVQQRIPEEKPVTDPPENLTGRRPQKRRFRHRQPGRAREPGQEQTGSERQVVHRCTEYRAADASALCMLARAGPLGASCASRATGQWPDSRSSILVRRR